jgi:phosphoribosylaminoimidazole-succinocarboxamide synthase
MTSAISHTDFPQLTLLKRGKVRDMYDLGEHLLMVATDRISAFDVVMTEPIPDKGAILTRISLFWFEMMTPLVANHVVTDDVSEYPKSCRPYASVLKGRSLLVKKARPLPIECVARGYISGSGWGSYQESGEVCGIKLPAGLKESDKLPEPIFTPATKEEVGTHDINIDFEEAAARIGRDLAERTRELTLAIYRKGAAFAETRGILIADTKFEFGLVGGELILIDELLTPDSSRFWPRASYTPGGSQQSYDKQYLRDYLLSTRWNKTPPPPPLPDEVIRGTRQKYLEALTQLSGSSHGL